MPRLYGRPKGEKQFTWSERLLVCPYLLVVCRLNLCLIHRWNQQPVTAYPPCGEQLVIRHDTADTLTRLQQELVNGSYTYLAILTSSSFLVSPAVKSIRQVLFSLPCCIESCIREQLADEVFYDTVISNSLKEYILWRMKKRSGSGHKSTKSHNHPNERVHSNCPVLESPIFYMVSWNNSQKRACYA